MLNPAVVDDGVLDAAIVDDKVLDATFEFALDAPVMIVEPIVTGMETTIDVPPPGHWVLRLVLTMGTVDPTCLAPKRGMLMVRKRSGRLG